jgi:flagellar hook protein FlgE
MGFATALSGLGAASVDLQVTGNNIANVNTIGFKESRAEFADVYATSLGGVSSTQPGSGVRVTEVAQQFNQGNIEFTQNSLDLAISGNGFFTLAADANASQPTTFTRNGAFQLDKDGNIVTDQGDFLMGYRPNGDKLSDGFSQGVFTTLVIDTSQGLPSATTEASTVLNLDSREVIPTATPLDPLNSSTYNATTSVNIFNSQGNSHIATTYFVKTGANQWDTFLYLDDRGISPAIAPATAATVEASGAVPTATPMQYTSAGKLDFYDVAGQTSKAIGTIDLSQVDPNLNVEPLDFTLDYADSTQFSSIFSINDLQQNGLPAGNLTGIDIDDTGAVIARFSNGGVKPIGQVALARFASNQALSKIGDTNWQESAGSGPAIFGTAGSNNFGGINSAALESSNVDLSAQLVNLIIAQQAYQANAKTITTEKEITQTILNV